MISLKMVNHHNLIWRQIKSTFVFLMFHSRHSEFAFLNEEEIERESTSTIIAFSLAFSVIMPSSRFDPTVRLHNEFDVMLDHPIYHNSTVSESWPFNACGVIVFK